jgi:hypothetical protein
MRFVDRALRASRLTDLLTRITDQPQDVLDAIANSMNIRASEPAIGGRGWPPLRRIRLEVRPSTPLGKDGGRIHVLYVAAGRRSKVPTCLRGSLC